MKNPLTLEAFAEWCEKQPADKAYDLASQEDCAVSMYLRAVGLPVVSTNLCHAHWCDEEGVIRGRFPKAWFSPVFFGDTTFGALAARLRSCQENPL